MDLNDAQARANAAVLLPEDIKVLQDQADKAGQEAADQRRRAEALRQERQHISLKVQALEAAAAATAAKPKLQAHLQAELEELRRTMAEASAAEAAARAAAAAAAAEAAATTARADALEQQLGLAQGVIWRQQADQDLALQAGVGTSMHGPPNQWTPDSNSQSALVYTIKYSVFKTYALSALCTTPVHNTGLQQVPLSFSPTSIAHLSLPALLTPPAQVMQRVMQRMDVQRQQLLEAGRRPLVQLPAPSVPPAPPVTFTAPTARPQLQQELPSLPAQAYQLAGPWPPQSGASLASAGMPWVRPVLPYTAPTAPAAAGNAVAPLPMYMVHQGHWHPAGPSVAVGQPQVLPASQQLPQRRWWEWCCCR